MEGTLADNSQRLQREIANSRGYNADRILNSNHIGSPPGEEDRNGKSDEKVYPSTSDGKAPAGPVGKRKYQRHPKVRRIMPCDVATSFLG